MQQRAGKAREENKSGNKKGEKALATRTQHPTWGSKKGDKGDKASEKRTQHPTKGKT